MRRTRPTFLALLAITAIPAAAQMPARTPRVYATSNVRYPVFYLLHGDGDTGQSWLMAGQANFILDNLIAEGKATPMIVVMPAGHTPRPAGVGAQPVARDPFLDDFAMDVMPYVEKNYRVLPGREQRAVAGLSMGGQQTLLDKYKIRYTYKETDGGHTWPNWRAYLREFTPMLFR